MLQMVLTPLLFLTSMPPTHPGASCLERFEYRQLHMGVETRLVLYTSDEASARRAATAAYSRIAMLDSIMSDYRSDSELNRLVAHAGAGPVQVSDELFYVLSRAQELARLSDGAFDVTASPVIRLWRQARRTGVLPSQQARAEAAARVGWQKLRLDPAARTAELLLPDMQLDLGGIGKGYASDAAIATLRDHGVDRALVEMGGDIVVSGPPPGQPGWRVALPHGPPDAKPLLLDHAAISTSGDTEQFVEIGGRRFSHIVDPRTGLGLETRISVTVVAPDGITADALSTTVSVLGRPRGAAFAEQHFPHARIYLRDALRTRQQK
jgi:FAD:protein FMN transferase